MGVNDVVGFLYGDAFCNECVALDFCKECFSINVSIFWGDRVASVEFLIGLFG